jgi:hypothetical protein
MLSGEAGDETSPPPLCRPNVVNVRAEQSPLTRLGLLSEREDVHFMTTGEALDQPEQTRGDAIHATPVDPPGHDQCELHWRPASIS